MHAYRKVGFFDGTYLPTAADSSVVAFHRWLRDFGDVENMWSPYKTPENADVLLSRDELIERKQSHTDQCASCSGARKRMKQLVEPALGATAALFAVRAFSGSKRVRLVQGLVALAILFAKEKVKGIVRRMDVGIWPPPRNRN